MKRWVLILPLCCLAVTYSFSQQPNIENFLSMIESGRAEEVRAELPSLLDQYPNNSGVLYLQAVLTTDGADAARLYQEIVDKYPSGEWADDALYKVYKFYSAIGLNRTADIKLNQLRARYPNSKYVSELSSVAPEEPTQQSTTATPPTKDDATESVPDMAVHPTEVSKSVGSFVLQVGVYSTWANANKQKQFFEYQKYPAEIVSKMKDDRELFVVYVGGYATMEEARSHGEEVKRTFDIQNIVVRR